MKRYFIFIILTMCFFMNSTAQNKVQKPNAPKEDIKVKREYDEKGNLIRFDSVYTYNWSGDTTLLKSLSPENLSKQFGDPFGFFSDSTFQVNPFFDHFDQQFAQPFGGKQDSLWMKKFGINPFPDFRLFSDSLALNHSDFDEFFKNFEGSKRDSISSKFPDKNRLWSHSKSFDKMMKMLQDQMKAMEEQHRKFFDEQPKWQEF